VADSKGIGFAAIGVGSLFVYAGIKGYSVPQTIQNIITGKKPATGQTEAVLTAAESPSSVGFLGSGSGAAAAADALKYNGSPYVWGGAPAENIGPTGIGNHDCSSLANWVYGHDLGLAIPFYGVGKYDGSQHGPPTMTWLAWTGCTTIGSDPSQAQAGDVCVWQTHMGIALGPNQMISAQDPSLGTGISNIALPGEQLFVRRLKALGG
jgi:cell wall-associated NlpC family hydrolase